MNGMKLGGTILGCLVLAASCTDAFAEDGGHVAVCRVGNISIIDKGFESRLGRMQTGDEFAMAVTGNAVAIEPDYASKIDPDSSGAGIVLRLFAADSTESGYIPRYAHSGRKDRLVFNIVQREGSRFAILATAWKPEAGQKLASAATILECTVRPEK